MVAGILQLVATGIQDKVLTEDPQITFFKSVYRRHTSFSVESVVQTFSTHADFGKTVTCVIGKLGDMINKSFIYLHLSEPIDNAFDIIDWVELHIGNKVIDRQTGEYIWLSHRMSSHDLDALHKLTSGSIVYIPLSFWFTKAPGQSLPLTALHSQIVQIVVRFKHLDQIYVPQYKITLDYSLESFKPGDIIKQGILTGKVISYHPVTKELRYTSDKPFVIHTPLNNVRPITSSTKITRNVKILNAYLLIDYVYLDKDERTTLMTTTHNLLIEQVHQTNTIKSFSPNIRHNMLIKAPIKTIYWLAQLDKTKEYVNVISSQILINGIVRDQIADGVYYNYVQPYQSHHNSPFLGFNMYSFALMPESTQPSGSANLSKVETTQLMLKLPNTINSMNTASVRSYAVGYNILQVTMGAAKLMF